MKPTDNFYYFVKGVFTSNATDEIKIRVIKNEMEKIEKGVICGNCQNKRDPDKCQACKWSEL